MSTWQAFGIGEDLDTARRPGQPSGGRLRSNVSAICRPEGWSDAGIFLHVGSAAGAMQLSIEVDNSQTLSLLGREGFAE